MVSQKTSAFFCHRIVERFLSKRENGFKYSALNTFATHSLEMQLFEVVLNIEFGTLSHIGDALYIVGSLNQWQSSGVFIGNIPDDGNTLQVRLSNIPKGNLEFSITRGNWQRLSCTSDGQLIAPFLINVDDDKEVNIHIAAWRDDFPGSTASEQVHILDQQFHFPNLNAYRTVWIYLPQSYEWNIEKKYPVIYMHDGQHLFDEATAVGRKGPVEWQVDKVINLDGREAIVVAIAHGGEEKDRLHDYVFRPVQGMENPGGEAYLKDIVEHLKPFVDKHYRTLKDSKYNAMLGSSLGGLLSLYAGLKYPHVFASFGVFSPSIWLDNGAYINEMANHKNDIIQKSIHYYFYGGGLENRKIKDRAPVEMDKDIAYIVSSIQSQLAAQTIVDINPIGKHGALYWQKAFPKFYDWWQSKILKE